MPAGNTRKKDKIQGQDKREINPLKSLREINLLRVSKMKSGRSLKTEFDIEKDVSFKYNLRCTLLSVRLNCSYVCFNNNCNSFSKKNLGSTILPILFLVDE